MTGWIFDIQSFCTHDGPGVRTAVFLQGCPLRCRWCHNPEGLERGPRLAFNAGRCIACGRCLPVCPGNGHRLDGGTHTLERRACTVCGSCAAVCPAQAVEIVGREVSAAEVLGIVAADAPFFQDSGGGLTVTGGEPLAQADFAQELLAGARALGIGTCVETCGFGKTADLLRLAAVTDIFLFDLKHTDDARHRAGTGVGNALILENLERLGAAGARIRLRLPWIPGYNDTEEHIAAVAGICARVPGIESVEILPYHALGAGKLDRLGATDRAETYREPGAAEVAAARAAFVDMGVKVVGCGNDIL